MKQIMECDAYCAYKAHLAHLGELQDEVSEAAEKGTRIHEMLFRLETGAEQEEGYDEEELEIAEGLFTRRQALVGKEFGNNPVETLAEERIFFRDFLEDRFSGQKDLAIIDRPNKKILILDYKTGLSHVEDPADWNWQLMALAVLVQQKYSIPRDFMYHMAIIQVMTPTKVGVFSGDQVWEASGKIMEKLDRPAFNPYIYQFNPDGNRCKFCSCRFKCPALNYNKDSLIASAGSIESSIVAMPNANLGELLDTLNQLDDVKTKAKNEAYVRIQGGASVPGYSIKTTAGQRRLEDTQTVLHRLMSAGVQPKDIEPMVKLSVTDVTKLLGPVTGLKGKALTEAVGTITEGCLKQTAGSSYLTNG